LLATAVVKMVSPLAAAIGLSAVVPQLEEIVFLGAAAGIAAGGKWLRNLGKSWIPF
jgi:hypothetical protein